MNITLYHAPKSRSMRVLWTLEEIGLPYQIQLVDSKAGEHKSPDYRKINPFGLIPAIKIDDKPLFESTAICMVLAELTPEKKLIPSLGSWERAQCFQWMSFATNTIENPILFYFENTIFLPEEKRNASRAEISRAQFREIASTFEKAALMEGEWLCGNDFTLADLLCGSILNWASSMKLTDGFTGIESYLARIRERPAFKRMLEK